MLRNISGDPFRRLYLIAACAGLAAALLVLIANSPALAQFVCTTTPTNITCTNAGTAGSFNNTTGGTGQNATTANSGTASGFFSVTTGGGNATSVNSGSANGVTAQTNAGGNATATNSGSVAGFIDASTVTGNATTTNSGSIVGGVLTESSGAGNALLVNLGIITGGVLAATPIGDNAIITNSGTITASTGPAIQFTDLGLETLNLLADSRILGDISLDFGDAVVNITGGTINGNILGTGRDTVNFAPGARNTFTYAAPFGFMALLSFSSQTSQKQGSQKSRCARHVPAWTRSGQSGDIS